MMNTEEMKDITIVCKDCGEEFAFTVGEQQFYKEKGLENQPIRCKDCRDKKKQQRDNRSNRDNRNNRYEDRNN